MLQIQTCKSIISLGQESHAALSASWAKTNRRSSGSCSSRTAVKYKRARIVPRRHRPISNQYIRWRWCTKSWGKFIIWRQTIIWHEWLRWGYWSQVVLEIGTRTRSVFGSLWYWFSDAVCVWRGDPSSVPAAEEWLFWCLVLATW